MITHRQRIESCLNGDKPDRTPVALWRHFPVDDQSPASLAAAILNYQHTFDFDLVKVTPASSYCLKDWGVEDEWLGATEGTRDYTKRIIRTPDDWLNLQPLDPYSGCLGDTLAALRTITGSLGNNTPVIQTIFSPLAQAKNLAGGEELLVHLRKYPHELHAGLTTIMESTIRFIEAAHACGIAGIFYAVQHAQYNLLSEQEFMAFGKPYDLHALKSAGDLWLNMVHLHGQNVMFDLVSDYPVQIINWHDQETSPSLSAARDRCQKVFCGGLQREKTLVLGTPESIREEAQSAIEVTQGRKFILGTGCVTPIHAPYGNLLAARRSVEA